VIVAPVYGEFKVAVGKPGVVGAATVSEPLMTTV
jgi:hypothetical protein